MSKAEVPVRKPNKTPSSIVTIRLKTAVEAEERIDTMSECARQLYNAVLGEALKRLHAIQNTKLYQLTIRLSKTTKENKEARYENFKTLNEEYKFSQYELESFGTRTKNASKFINKHLGTHVCQKISIRAFKAVQKLALGKAKKVSFKRKGEFVSLEGKNNKTFIRYSNGYALIDDLTLKCLIDPKDKLIQHALSHRIKYCRIIREAIKSKFRYYIQLIVEMKPYQKYTMGREEGALDVGPSTWALVTDSSASLNIFCAELVDLQKQKRVLQRSVDRKFRAANPNNYNLNGTIKKGRHKWFRSKKLKTEQSNLVELERKLKVTRKNLHGRDINNILRKCKSIKTEKLSYRAFQKMFGKSVGRRAPSMFIKRLGEKLTNFGGTFQEFSTRQTKLSQTCHCGSVKKKKLSERWHDCHCGVKAQRDLYSAFLAKHVTKSGTLNIKKAKLEWEFINPILDTCILNLRKGNQKISTFGI